MRAESNLEKWPAIWQPSKSRNQKALRVFEREVASADGSRMVSRAEVGYTHLGTLTTKDQRMYYALIHLWECISLILEGAQSWPQPPFRRPEPAESRLRAELPAPQNQTDPLPKKAMERGVPMVTKCGQVTAGGQREASCSKDYTNPRPMAQHAQPAQPARKCRICFPLKKLPFKRMVFRPRRFGAGAKPL